MSDAARDLAGKRKKEAGLAAEKTKSGRETRYSRASGAARN